MRAKIILLSLFLLFSNYSLFSTTYYVRSASGSDANDGLTVGTAFQTLTKVFGGSPVLADGDIIDISGTFDYYISKTITKSITIQGTNKATSIIQGLSGSKKRCFSIGDGTYTPSVSIENITFQNFDNFDDATSTVGGVLNVYPGTNLTCRNVNFLNNLCYSGGAVNMSGGTALFEDCYFYNNQTKVRSAATNADGAAINVSVASPSTVNIALTIDRCLFEANKTQNVASAVRFRSQSTGNSNLLIRNSTFTGNIVKLPSASTSSGAIYIELPAATQSASIINNTIAYNSSEVASASARAGISVTGTADKLQIINNILYSNTNASSGNISIATAVLFKECRNNITDQNYDFVANTTASMASGNTSNTNNTLLGLAAILASNGGATKTLLLSTNSVAKNTGYTTGAPTIDQRSFKRIGVPDVGACEQITYFRSKTSGNWDQTGSWESSTDNSSWINALSIPTSGDGLVSILSGNEITINSNSASSELNIGAGAKLTLNSGISHSVSENITINSDGTNGTGTFVDLNTNGGLTVNGTTSVKQYVTSTAIGSTGRNWYISSPVSAAASNTITTATGNGLVYYGGSNNWLDAGTTMEVLKGYIAKSPAQNTTINFTGGNLNTGSLLVDNLPLGFNLVGNPYPSFVNWSNATKSGISTSIWYRSKSSGSYQFQTYNVAGEGVSVNGGTDIIPPMQSFWVKVTNSVNTLGFANNMRSHQDQSLVSNRLKLPKTYTQKLLRLQVSNGTNNDETVIYFNPNALDTKDDFDSQKMFNNTTNIPEIYTVIGTEKFAINGLGEVTYNTEIPLGINILEANNFSLGVTELKNFSNDIRVILKDNELHTEQDIATGAIYNFESGVVNTTGRFSIIFKQGGTTTGVQNSSLSTVKVFVDLENRIAVTAPEKSSFSVYNSLGQNLLNGFVTVAPEIIPVKPEKGVYFVKITVAGKTDIHKIIIR